jgi:hypothetical protein
MRRVSIADDFEAIRLRLEELRRERRGRHAGEPATNRPIEEPDAVAHCPPGTVQRLLAQARRSSSR